MKKISLIAGTLSIALLLSCGKKSEGVNSDIVNNSNTANGNSSGKIAAITFEEKEYNFGEIIEGQIVEHDFKFKNTGENDLVITNAEGSCGCTVPEYPKEAIKPGGSGVIKVKFNSTGKPNHQEKTVKITANTEPNIVELRIKGDVVAK